MNAPSSPWSTDRPPDLDAPGEWDRLIEAVSPPAMLVAIHAAMSESLSRHASADDIWQETLLHAWRDRSGMEWRGLPAFRRWLLSIARHRILDLQKGARSMRRRREVASPVSAGQETGSVFAGPIATTSPSRAARDREQAERMRMALASVPAADRDVLRLRLFEELPLEDVAARLGLGVSAVRHRLRRAAATYRARLRQLDLESGA